MTRRSNNTQRGSYSRKKLTNDALAVAVPLSEDVAEVDGESEALCKESSSPCVW
jgi:hypothetical protein